MTLPPLLDPPDDGGADCVSCGGCCHHGPSTVHLLDTDEARVLARPGGEGGLLRPTVIDPRPPRFPFLNHTGDRCAALDVSVPGRYPCAIYDVRPDDCRMVEPGSPACLEARTLGRLGTRV